MKRLVILGAGGLGREVLAWARQSAACGREWQVAGFLDDNPRALDGFSPGVPLLGAIATHTPKADEVFLCAMGRVEAKRSSVERICSRGGAFVSLVHPTVVLGDGVALGTGVILCPHAVVTSQARLGDFVTVNLHSTVAHDAVVGDWSQLHCHVDVTGGVVIEEEVTVGSHASLLPGVRVGRGALVGAGAVVTQDVAPGITVYGAPARPLIRRGEADRHE